MFVQGLIDERIESAYEDCDIKINDLYNEVSEVFDPVDIAGCNKKLKVLAGFKEEIKNIHFNVDLSDLEKIIINRFSKDIFEFQAGNDKISDKYDGIINELIESKKKEIEVENGKLRRDFEETNEVYLFLEEKRQKLLLYSDEVIEVASTYGITTSDIDVSNESFELEELNTLYNEFLDYMQTSSEKINLITWIKEKVPNVNTRGIILLILLVLCFTPLLSVLGILFFIAITMAQIKHSDHVKKHLLLMGLMFNINPLEKGFVDGEPSTIQLPEDFTETDEETVKAVVEWEEELKKREEFNPEDEMQEELNYLNINALKINKQVKEKSDAIEDTKKGILLSIAEEIKKVEDLRENMLKNLKVLGDDFSICVIFNTKFALGVDNDGLEEFVDIGLRNVSIKPIPDPTTRKYFLSVMLANALCNVRFGSLSVIVHDPNNMGRDIVDLYDEKFSEIIQFRHSELQNIIKELSEVTQSNLETMHSLSITEFNNNCMESGRKPLQYRLLLVLSQPKKIEDDEALREFMRFSANYGVFVWIISSNSFDNTLQFNKPFERVTNPYPIKDYNKFCKKIVECVKMSEKSIPKSSLMWDKFSNSICTDDKMWTYSADEFIELDVGYKDGDPNMKDNFKVGNVGNVHCLLVGGTGSGKSVLLNNLIANATKKYSPEALELWLVDFKGAEFSFYMKQQGFQYNLPHIKACLCTSDGEYAVSLYKALVKEAERRYALFIELGFKNLVQYNAVMRNQGTPEKCMPRILVINDEFQVMFEKCESKIAEAVKGDITYIGKVARACGVHLLFASQSMKGTLSQDLLDQFSLRMVLRCSEEVSDSLLNNRCSGKIRESNGWLYVKSIGMEPLLHRTPYIPENMLREHIKKCHDMAIERQLPEKDIITYREETKHSIEEIDEVYSKYGETMDLSNCMFFGPPMIYKDNKAPINVVLDNSNNTHIFALLPDPSDMVDFYRTCKRNIFNHKNKSTKILCNAQLQDIYTILEFDIDTPESMRNFSLPTESPHKIVSLLKDIYENRKGKEDLSPLYVFLSGWEKAIGFGVDRDPRLTADVGQLLQLCGETDMHFVFLCTAIGEIPKVVYGACDTIICGKVQEKDSYTLMDSKSASKSYDLKNGYMYINFKGEVSRAKIYQSGDKREVKKATIVIK